MYGDPVHVDKKTEEKKSKSKLEELEKKLKEITQVVDSWD
jgi:hypothetical protein